MTAPNWQPGDPLYERDPLRWTDVLPILMLKDDNTPDTRCTASWPKPEWLHDLDRQDEP